MAILFKGLTRVAAAIVLAGGLASAAIAEELDPDSADFDPQKQFVITPYGAILGDPAQFLELGSDRTGFTYCATAPNKERGLLLMASLVIPAQGNSDGGGHALMMSVDEARNFIAYLRKAPEWSKVAADNKVGEFSKLIGDVVGNEGAGEHLAVLFVSDDQSRGAVRIEHTLGGVNKAFLFGVNAGLKFARQAEYALEKAISEAPEAAPAEDASKTDLFK